MTPSGNDQLVALDTSAYSRLRLGHEALHEMVASAPAVLVPMIVLGELEAGFRLGSRERENRQVLDEFLAEPFVTLVPVTSAVARSYGALFAELRRRGTPIPVNDLWIAASTIVAGATLLTFDHDFGSVPGLACRILAP